MSQENVEPVRVPVGARPSIRQFRLALRFPAVTALILHLLMLVPDRWWPRRNVDLVVALQLPPALDLAPFFRDDDRWAALSKANAPLFHTDCETVPPGVPGTEKVYLGFDGLRAAWLEWLAPWSSYRTETKEVIEAGERILLIVNDFGRREGSTQEVKIDGAAIWTFRDGKIARFEAFADRAEAVKAVGLEE